mgnify:CR=1 FL=1
MENEGISAEQREMRDLRLALGTANKEIRRLKAVLNERDVEIMRLKRTSGEARARLDKAMGAGLERRHRQGSGATG